MKIRIDAICAGQPSDLPSGKVSAIRKTPIQGPATIGLRGIESDEQVDRRFHGWPAMALHQYPYENYAWLRHHFGALPRLDRYGSMGENIGAEGVSEYDVAIGDRFRFGTALIEISQPRQPCATIENHLGTKAVVAAIVASARCGWFFRVLEPGMVRAGERLERVERGVPAWTIARAFLAVYGKNRATDAELEELSQLDRVSDRFVGDIRKRLG